ncbi:hypothetical protein DRE_03520 [Drechslerella stenobrocha 248]|uniref:Uncharacterized protein n=1 Tax=Drechslerella stenobrocha 248 TaxID=1043628 RepID=W7HSU7_9PEZI|nr:hypothetical protein DRE_03520 [Drechslerella stenobrocha 248]
MKFTSFTALCSAVLPVALVTGSVIPRQERLVWAYNYKYENGTLRGDITARPMNCPTASRYPLIEVFWAAGESWQETPIVATRGGWHDSVGNPWYNFRGDAPDVTQFYLKLTCGDVISYNPGNFVNYQVQH